MNGYPPRFSGEYRPFLMHNLSSADMHHIWSNMDSEYIIRTYTRIPETSYLCHVLVPNMTLWHVWKYLRSIFFCNYCISVCVIAQTNTILGSYMIVSHIVTLDSLKNTDHFQCIFF